MNKPFPYDDTFLARWLDGSLTPEELEAFRADKDFAAFQRIAESSMDLETPAMRSIEGAWEHFIQKRSESESIDKLAPSRKATVRRLSRWWTSAAAAIAILIVSYVVFFHNTQEHITTAIAEKQRVSLPDGSTAFLNAVSSLKWSSSDYADVRTIHLDGEAFFEVKEGSTFSVHTANGTVQVLGTSFNVRSRTKSLRVSCYTGKVGVHFSEPDDQEELTPGNGLAAEDGEVIDLFVIRENRKAPTWSEGESRFDEAAISEVFNELERQYEVSVQYPETLREISAYNGGFPHGDLNTALKVICSSIDYQFSIDGKKVSIYK